MVRREVRRETWSGETDRLVTDVEGEVRAPSSGYDQQSTTAQRGLPALVVNSTLWLLTYSVRGGAHAVGVLGGRRAVVAVGAGFGARGPAVSTRGHRQERRGP